MTASVPATVADVPACRDCGKPMVRFPLAWRCPGCNAVIPLPPPPSPQLTVAIDDEGRENLRKMDPEAAAHFADAQRWLEGQR